MKSTKKTFLAAAALTAALSAPALAQTPGVDSANQNQGGGATSTDPSNESNRNNASGARTEGDSRFGTQTDVNTGVGTNPNTNATTASGADVNAQGEIGAMPSGDASTDDIEQPKKKRTFWDRVFGRNKHLDAGKNTGSGTRERSADVTPSNP
jgi:hypothetical protein